MVRPARCPAPPRQGTFCSLTSMLLNSSIRFSDGGRVASGEIGMTVDACDRGNHCRTQTKATAGEPWTKRTESMQPPEPGAPTAWRASSPSGARRGWLAR